MNLVKPFFLLLAAALTFACNEAAKPTVSELANAVLIPKPASIQQTEGAFELNNETAVLVSGGDEVWKRVAYFLSNKMAESFGKDISVVDAGQGNPESNFIIFQKSNDPQLGNEGYLLEIADASIKISANSPAGAFYAVQTIFQLLPEGFGKDKTENFALAAGTIKDFPEYGMRGSMLDVSRHFFGVEDVKRYIDYLAFYKMNTLHLHLSDDQGWRIEIKSWPKLTEHGGSTQVGGGKGGFYTQEQYKDLVKYAQERFITIIPEIDMPGHTNAALASYAELNCNNTAPELYTKTEVGFSTLCVRKDITYKFIDDVVRELAAITPGPYIHLGGDESHVTKKADFIYFINRIQPIPKKYGKKMIGWEEIAQAKLDSNTIVQYWSNAEHAKEAVKQGAKIIMSPASKLYLDMKYDTTTKLGLKWAGLIEVDSAYNWTVSKRVEGIPRESILGVEAPLWTETLTTMDEIEYMVFPRLPGVAEIGWSPESGRSWDEYKTRLARHGPRMKAMGIDFYESNKVAWEK
jgi:hexosaminidase